MVRSKLIKATSRALEDAYEQGIIEGRKKTWRITNGGETGKSDATTLHELFRELNVTPRLVLIDGYEAGPEDVALHAGQLITLSTRK